MNSSLISSALSNYEDVNRSLSSLNDFMNNSSNSKPFYVDSIDTSMINNTDGNVDFSKIKRNKNNKITNLDILIDNGINSVENKKNYSTPSRKQGRTLFLKSIKVKYINTPKSTINELPIIKRKTNKSLGNSFPDRYYNMNYRYNGNKHKISLTEGSIESLEQNIDKQYIDTQSRRRLCKILLKANKRK